MCYFYLWLQMEWYWKKRPNAPRTCTTCHSSPVATAEQMDDSITSKFDQHCLSLMPQEQDEGWETEICQYLKDLLVNVEKHSNILQWWQVCITATCITS